MCKSDPPLSTKNTKHNATKLSSTTARPRQVNGGQRRQDVADTEGKTSTQQVNGGHVNTSKNFECAARQHQDKDGSTTYPKQHQLQQTTRQGWIDNNVLELKTYNLRQTAKPSNLQPARQQQQLTTRRDNNNNFNLNPTAATARPKAGEQVPLERARQQQDPRLVNR